MLSALLLLLDADSLEWASAKKLLASPTLKKTMVNLDKSNIPDHILRKLEIYTSSDMFHPDFVAKCSMAAA